MRVWDLRPGVYRLTGGPDENYDDLPDQHSLQRSVELERGAVVPLVLPPQQLFVITLAAETLRPPAHAPDVALGAEDATLSPLGTQVSVRVHNIGTATALKVRVSVTDDQLQEIGSAEAGDLGWPEDLLPATRQVVVPLTRPVTTRYRVTLSCANTEVTRVNNSVVLSPPTSNHR
ncbi:MAG: hypothetical protein QHJ73_09090, partial [Armatimonadota bacterium]|nr:hypothetical protein [Armatimonadota bacterium]